jgi:hypothetical protein
MRALVLGAVLVAGAGMGDERDTPRAIDAAEAKGTYRGVKLWGESLHGAEHLRLTLDGTTKARGAWSSVFGGEDRGSAELAFEGVRIERGRFQARLVGKRPTGLPEVLVGRFVTRFPPANGKGPVRDGLVLDGGWFLARDP